MGYSFFSLFGCLFIVSTCSYPSLWYPSSCRKVTLFFDVVFWIYSFCLILLPFLSYNSVKLLSNMASDGFALKTDHHSRRKASLASYSLMSLSSLIFAWAEERRISVSSCLTVTGIFSYFRSVYLLSKFHWSLIYFAACYVNSGLVRDLA